jgi:hypothetical protein
MYGDTGDLRKSFLHAVFQSCGDVVDLRNGQPAVHGAVAGRQNLVFHLAHVDFVAIHQLMEFSGQRVDVVLDGTTKPGHFASLAIHHRDMSAERLDVNIYHRIGAI